MDAGRFYGKRSRFQVRSLPPDSDDEALPASGDDEPNVDKDFSDQSESEGKFENMCIVVNQLTIFCFVFVFTSFFIICIYKFIL